MDKSKYHTQNEIITYIIDAFNAMLIDLDLSSTWQVIRSNQPTIQRLENNTIYVDIISKRRLGTQGTKSVKTDSGWKTASIWYESMLVEVGAFKQRAPETDDEYTLSSSDIIGYLQGCVNANNDLGTSSEYSTRHGLNKKTYFSKDWMQLIRSNNIRELDYETDSGLKEKFPQFEFEIVIEQQLIKDEKEISTISIGTEPV